MNNTDIKDLDSDITQLSNIIMGLQQKKVIYHEVTTAIARIDKVIISPDGFEGFATKLSTIPNPYGIRDIPFPKKWKFGANWDFLSIEHGTIHATNIDWTIWIDPLLINEIEKSLSLNNVNDVHKLLWGDPLFNNI